MRPRGRFVVTPPGSGGSAAPLPRWRRLCAKPSNPQAPHPASPQKNGERGRKAPELLSPPLRGERRGDGPGVWPDRRRQLASPLSVPLAKRGRRRRGRRRSRHLRNDELTSYVKNGRWLNGHPSIVVGKPPEPCYGVLHDVILTKLFDMIRTAHCRRRGAVCQIEEHIMSQITIHIHPELAEKLLADGDQGARALAALSRQAIRVVQACGRRIAYAPIALPNGTGCAMSAWGGARGLVVEIAPPAPRSPAAASSARRRRKGTTGRPSRRRD
jgi:hypothetical protein